MIGFIFTAASLIWFYKTNEAMILVAAAIFYLGFVLDMQLPKLTNK